MAIKMTKLKSIFAATALMLCLGTACTHGGNAADKDGSKKDSAATQAKDNSANGSAVTTNSDGTSGNMVGGAMMTDEKDVVDNAMASADHTTLVAALKQAGLVETLKGPGPFTVFAPTNEAFDKIDKATLAKLMTGPEKEKLAKILNYHIVGGKLKITDLTPGAPLNTVAGEQLTFIMKDNKPYIQDANGNIAAITIQDIEDKNGVTHVIDAVMMPKATKEKKAGKKAGM